MWRQTIWVSEAWLGSDPSHIVCRAIRSCRCGTIVGKQRTFREVRWWVIRGWSVPWQICSADAKWAQRGAVWLYFISFSLSPLPKERTILRRHDDLGKMAKPLINNKGMTQFFTRPFICYYLSGWCRKSEILSLFPEQISHCFITSCGISWL